MLTREKTYVDPSSAKTYGDNNTIQFKQGSEFLIDNREHLKPPFLDVGCGTGELTAFIGKKFNSPITGVDISEARIKYANSENASHEVTFIVGNATKLDQQPAIKPESFGTGMSLNALHHVAKKDQLEAFTQIRKCLKPNGSALLLVPGRSPIIHDSINEVTKHPRWQLYFADFDLNAARTYEGEEYYKNLCTKAGFFRTQVTTSFESGGKELNFNEMKKFLSGWLAHLAHLKEKIPDKKMFDSVSDQFLSEIVSLYFLKMNKKINETVPIEIAQNKIVAQMSPGHARPRSSL